MDSEDDDAHFTLDELLGHFKTLPEWDVTVPGRWTAFDERFTTDDLAQVDYDVRAETIARSKRSKAAKASARPAAAQDGVTAPDAKASSAPPPDALRRLSALAKTRWRLRPHQLVRDTGVETLKGGILRELCKLADETTVSWHEAADTLHQAAELRRKCPPQGTSSTSAFQLSDVGVAKRTLLRMERNDSTRTSPQLTPSPAATGSKRRAPEQESPPSPVATGSKRRAPEQESPQAMDGDWPFNITTNNVTLRKTSYCGTKRRMIAFPATMEGGTSDNDEARGDTILQHDTPGHAVASCERSEEQAIALRDAEDTERTPEKGRAHQGDLLADVSSPIPYLDGPPHHGDTSLDGEDLYDGQTLSSWDSPSSSKFETPAQMRDTPPVQHTSVQNFAEAETRTAAVAPQPFRPGGPASSLVRVISPKPLELSASSAREDTTLMVQQHISPANGEKASVAAGTRTEDRRQTEHPNRPNQSFKQPDQPNQSSKQDSSSSIAPMLRPPSTSLTKTDVSVLLRSQSATAQQLPPTTTQGALLTLRPNRWLSSTAVAASINAFNPDPKVHKIYESPFLDVTGTGTDNDKHAQRVGSRAESQHYFALQVDRCHWKLAHLDRTTKQLEVYDPLPSLAKPTSAALHLKLVQDFARHIDSFDLRAPPALYQNNTYDCGIYIAVRAILAMHAQCPPHDILPTVWRRAFARCLCLSIPDDPVFSSLDDPGLAELSPQRITQQLALSLELDLSKSNAPPEATEQDVRKIHQFVQCLRLLSQESLFVAELYKSLRDVETGLEEARRLIDWYQEIKDKRPTNMTQLSSVVESTIQHCERNIETQQSEILRLDRMLSCQQGLEEDAQAYGQEAAKWGRTAIDTANVVREKALQTLRDMEWVKDTL